MTDAFEVTLEARLQSDDISLLNFDTQVTLEDEFDAFLPRLSMTYDWSDDASVYFSVAKGNKPGTFNNTAPPGLLSVDEEELVAYELGTKVGFDGGRTFLSAAVFFLDWTNQVFRFNDPNFAIGSYFVNSGETDISGLELFASSRFGNGFSASVGYAYTDAEFKIFESNDNRTVFGVADVSGNLTPRTPESSATATLAYRQPIGGGQTELFVRGDLNYKSKMYVDEMNQGYFCPCTYLNLRAGLEFERLTVSVFVNNVTDDDSPTAGFIFRDQRSPLSPFVAAYAPLVGLPESRQVGLSINYDWGR